MNKNVFFVLLMVLVSSIAFASEKAAKSTASISANKDFSHWSIGVKGGTNYFDIYDNPMMRDDQWHLIAGAVLEYTINPIIGIGAEYELNPFSNAIKQNGILFTPKAFGKTQDASLFGSLNLSNLLKPERHGIWKKTSIYANLGLGAGFFDYDTKSIKYPNSGSGIAPLGYVGLNAEYNLSKALAIGLESQYRHYLKKDMGGIYSQLDANNGGTATLGLRYKFGAIAKKHVRNISMSEYNYVPAPVVEVVPEPKPEPAPVVEPKPVMKYSYENIRFKFDSSELTDESVAIVDNLINTLNHTEGWKMLKINGYTDSVGEEVYNQALSDRRAASVKKYLIDKGIPESKLDLTGYGEERPKDTNETVEGRFQNRRAEFVIIK